jgi:hypothetical protein
MMIYSSCTVFRTNALYVFLQFPVYGLFDTVLLYRFTTRPLIQDRCDRLPEREAL